MIDEKTVLAIVPARAGSKGLQNKNVRLFCGQPLLTWPLQALKKTPEVDTILLSTDSEKYRQIGLSLGVQAPFLRPASLSTDAATSVDVLLHAISYYESIGKVYDYVVMLEPTSPLTESFDVSKGLKTINDKSGNVDAIVGVGQVLDQHPNFLLEIGTDGLMKPFDGKEGFLAQRRQEISKLYFLDGSLYVSDITSLKNKKTFYHTRTFAMVMENYKNIEIDTEEDFIMAEALASSKNVRKFKRTGGKDGKK